MKRQQPLACVETDCCGRAVVRGWCSKHYARWKRHGDVNAVRVDMSNRIYADAPTRFMAKVEKTDGCWLWTAHKNRQGYGAFDRVMAHRWSYNHFVGPIPEDLVLDHLCRNRACVNPDHLEAVPSPVNILRGFGPPANNKRRTHCLAGHHLSGDNVRTYVRPGTGKPMRVCVPCHRKGPDTRNWSTGSGTLQICEDDGFVLIRGSWGKPVLVMTPSAWRDFRDHVKRGDYDHIGEAS